MDETLARAMQKALKARGFRTELPLEGQRHSDLTWIEVIVGDFTARCHSLEDARAASFRPPAEEFFSLAGGLDFRRFYSFDPGNSWYAAVNKGSFSITARTRHNANGAFRLEAEIWDSRPEVEWKSSDFRRSWVYRAPNPFPSIQAAKVYFGQLALPSEPLAASAQSSNAKVDRKEESQAQVIEPIAAVPAKVAPADQQQLALFLHEPRSKTGTVPQSRKAGKNRDRSPVRRASRPA